MIFVTLLLAPVGLAHASDASEGSDSLAASATSQPDGAAQARALGILFVEGSNSTVIVEKDGKRFLVDLVSRDIKKASPSSTEASAHSQTEGTPAPQEQSLASRSPSTTPKPRVYEAGDDYLLSLPSGRRLERHGFYVNFNHRFVFDPTFTGKSRGHILGGLDGFSVSSFGFRYGATDKLSLGIYRSPSVIGRPLQLTAGYDFLSERDRQPINAGLRFSVEGRNDFSRDFTASFEGIFSRSLTRRAQIYVVPTVSLANRRLLGPGFNLEDPQPEVPGFNTFSLGVGAAVDVRPSVALVAEVIPTLVNGRELGIHRPAYAFGIQKKVWRHAFTFGFTNSPGTTISQRAGTRATFMGNPSADTPSGLFIAFDLTRQIF